MKELMKNLSGQKKLLAGFAQIALLGAILGWMIPADFGWGIFGMLHYTYHEVVLGCFFWITVCSAVAYRARCGLHASLLTLCLLIPVLCGYYVSSYWHYCYLNRSLLGLGMLLLLPAAFAAWILRATRSSAQMRTVVRVAGIAAMVFDTAVIQMFSPLNVLIEGALLLFFLYTVDCASRTEKNQENKSIYEQFITLSYLLKRI